MDSLQQQKEVVKANELAIRGIAPRASRPEDATEDMAELSAIDEDDAPLGQEVPVSPTASLHPTPKTTVPPRAHSSALVHFIMTGQIPRAEDMAEDTAEFSAIPEDDTSLGQEVPASPTASLRPTPKTVPEVPEKVYFMDVEVPRYSGAACQEKFPVIYGFLEGSYYDISPSGSSKMASTFSTMIRRVAAGPDLTLCFADKEDPGLLEHVTKKFSRESAACVTANDVTFTDETDGPYGFISLKYVELGLYHVERVVVIIPGQGCSVDPANQRGHVEFFADLGVYYTDDHLREHFPWHPSNDEKVYFMDVEVPRNSRAACQEKFPVIYGFLEGSRYDISSSGSSKMASTFSTMIRRVATGPDLTLCFADKEDPGLMEYVSEQITMEYAECVRANDITFTDSTEGPYGFISLKYVEPGLYHVEWVVVIIPGQGDKKASEDPANQRGHVESFADRGVYYTNDHLRQHFPWHWANDIGKIHFNPSDTRPR